MSAFSDTQYGFKWGACEVTRLCSDEPKGWIVLGIDTPKDRLQIYVTKTGKIRVSSQKSGEVLPSPPEPTP